LITLGPLTNLALALCKDSGLVTSAITHLGIMGGCGNGRGNATRTCEFNVYADPEAAEKIFLMSSHFKKVTCVPWELTVKYPIPWDIFDRHIRNHNEKTTVLGRFLSSITHYSFVQPRECTESSALGTRGEDRGAVICDLLATDVILNEEIITNIDFVHIDVETQGMYTRGTTVVDFGHCFDGVKRERTVRWVTDIDVELYAASFESLFVNMTVRNLDHFKYIKSASRGDEEKIILSTLAETFQNWKEWSIIREAPKSWRVDSTGVLEIEGLEGSIWGTPELRMEQFNSTEGPVSNIFCFTKFTDFGNVKLESFSVSVSFVPKSHGEQAGILLYANDLNWVKLVVEGNKTGDTMITLASQDDGNPKVLGKILNVENDGSRKFRLGLRIVEGSSVEATVDNERISTSSSCILPTGAEKFEIRPAVMGHSTGIGHWMCFTAQGVSWAWLD